MCLLQYIAYMHAMSSSNKTYTRELQSHLLGLDIALHCMYVMYRSGFLLVLEHSSLEDSDPKVESEFMQLAIPEPQPPEPDPGPSETGPPSLQLLKDPDQILEVGSSLTVPPVPPSFPRSSQTEGTD